VDVTFQVAREMIAAHRCVLAARSQVFMAELFGPMKEKSISYILIDDMDATVFRAMLHFIYTDTMADIDKEDDALVITQHLLVAADRYGIERLKLICEEKLCDYYINTSTVATTLALAEQHGCKGLKEACFDFLKMPSNLKVAMANDGFDHLMSSCPSVVKELLAKVAPCP
jgi:speckle-type POZ protein